MNRTEQLVNALRAAGFRITPQRVAICRALAESKEHPTAAAIYRQVSSQFAGTSQATVYNTLTVLRDLGEIFEVGLGLNRTHYEPDPSPHVNLICLRCGRIEDVDDPTVTALSAELAQAQGLRLKAASMDLYGYCRACEAVPSVAGVSEGCERCNE